MTALGFFMSGFVKHHVFSVQIQYLARLKDKIEQVNASVSKETLELLNNMISRTNLLR